MHDESPGGQACADRTLAFWTDQSRFNTYGSRASRKIPGRVDAADKGIRVAAALAFGMITSALIAG